MKKYMCRWSRGEEDFLNSSSSNMYEHKIVGSERSTRVSWETVAAGTKKAPVVLGPAGNFGSHVLFRVKIYTYRCMEH